MWALEQDGEAETSSAFTSLPPVSVVFAADSPAPTNHPQDFIFKASFWAFRPLITATQHLSDLHYKEYRYVVGTRKTHGNHSCALEMVSVSAEPSCQLTSSTAQGLLQRALPAKSSPVYLRSSSLLLSLVFFQCCLVLPLCLPHASSPAISSLEAVGVCYRQSFIQSKLSFRYSRGALRLTWEPLAWREKQFVALYDRHLTRERRVESLKFEVQSLLQHNQALQQIVTRAKATLSLRIAHATLLTISIAHFESCSAVAPAKLSGVSGNLDRYRHLLSFLTHH